MLSIDHCVMNNTEANQGHVEKARKWAKLVVDPLTWLHNKWLHSKTAIPSVTYIGSDWTVTVINVVNCQQDGDWIANGIVVTMLQAINNGDYTVTIQSPCTEAYPGAFPPPSLKGRQKKKGKGKGKKKRRKKRGRKKLYNISTWRIGRHSSTRRGVPEGLKGRKLQGRQIEGRGVGWGRHCSTLLQGAKINDSLDPPVCDLLDTPLM